MKKLLSVLISVLAAVGVGLSADYAKFDNVSSANSTTFTNQVSTSGGLIPAGENWTLETSSPGWTGRGWSGFTDFNNKIWLMGGLSGPGFVNNNDVWYSADGVNWSQATAAASWSARTPRALSYDNKMWVMGGFSLNDVWYSTNGTNWTQATASAAWQGRRRFALMSFNGSMWVMGGENGSSVSLQDVWWSTDGVTWTQAPDAPWTNRYSMSYGVYDSKMWIVGGYSYDLSGRTNDVWSTTDGTNWTQVTAAADFGLRANDSPLGIHDGKMFFVGGNQEVGGSTNDVWCSTNGSDWTVATSSIGWDNGTSSREGYGVVSQFGKLWVLGGGFAFGGVKYSDIYSTEIGEYIYGSTASPAGQHVAATFLPDVGNSRDLGSAAYPWRDLYLSTNSIYMGGVSVLKYNSVDGRLEPQVPLYTPTGVTNDFDGLLVNELTGNMLTVSNGAFVILSSSNLQVMGSFLPTTSNAVDLGSAAFPFRDLFLGSNSIWMAGIKFASYSNGTFVSGAPMANQDGVPYADSNTVAVIEGANSGFDSQYDTTMTWDRGTRTLTLAPTGSVFYVNSYGVRRSYTNATTTIPDAEGLHFIYFDQNGVLTNSQTAWTIMAGEAQASIIQWDAVNDVELLFADERHGNTMSDTTHSWIHQTQGAQWSSGGTLIRNTLTTGAPNVNGANTVASITPCTIYDEDIVISLGTNSMRMGSQTSVVDSNSAAWFPVTYASGNTASFVWRGKTPDPWPFPYSGNVPQYNQLVGGTNWTLTAVTEDNYYVMWVFATDSAISNAYYIVPHHTIYATLGAAQSGATPETIFANRTTGLAPEIKLMYRIIFLFNAAGGGSYSTAVKSSRLNDVVDYRTDNTRPLNNAPSQSHGALTGLENDDHPQYLLRSEQVYSYTLSLQDPTNGLAYWMPNPFGTRSCTLTRIYAKTHGMTGAVDIVSQHETDGWYTYSSVTNGVAATETGTAQTSFTGSTAITNGMRIGFIPGALSAFATTNMVSVDFTFTIP